MQVVEAEAVRPIGEPDPLELLTNRELVTRAIAQMLWLVGYTALIFLVGILPATAIFVPAYLIIEGGTGIWRALAIALFYMLAMFMLFDQILHMPWPTALIGDIWPQLRDIWGLRLV